MSQENIAFILHILMHMQQSVHSEVHSLNKMLHLNSLFSTKLGQQHQQEKITLFTSTDSQSQLHWILSSKSISTCLYKEYNIHHLGPLDDSVCSFPAIMDALSRFQSQALPIKVYLDHLGEQLGEIVNLLALSNCNVWPASLMISSLDSLPRCLH